MDLKVEIWFVLLISSLFSNSRQLVLAKSQVPCFFIFGDSLSDSGNNNGLQTLAKVNYPPYGIDNKHGPTGRFTNGRNVVDITGQFLGFTNSIPPFATAQGPEILNGVNYASGSAGILDESGQELGARITMNKQLQNHKMTTSRVESWLGNKKASTDYLKKCIYTVGMGSNDYINNYLMPKYYPASRKYNPNQFATVLVEQYSRQLKDLYKYGARKIVVFGLGPIGCTPAEIALHRRNGSACVDSINANVEMFNNRLKTLIDDLNKDFHDAHFTYINVTGILSGDPSALGIKVPNAPCCPVSSIGQCLPNRAPCADRSKYAFFDAFHPTETTVSLVASRAYSAATSSDVHPIDIKRLARL